MGRETIGKLSTELLHKDTKSDHTAGEQMVEQLENYESNFFECVNRGKGMFPGDFYVVVITKREKLFANVLRNFFFPTLACPTPTWDQIVYKYTRKDESHDLIWVIPDKHTCGFMIENRLALDLSQQQLLKFVMDFKDGSLDRKARTLNGESLIIDTKIA